MKLIASYVSPAALALAGPARAAAVAVARFYVPEEALERLETAFGEAWKNSVRFGSPRGERSLIWVRFLLSDECLFVAITDTGDGFDPHSKKMPDPNSFAEHGYGVPLIREFTDRVLWEYGGRSVRLGYWRVPKDEGPGI